MSPYGGVGHGGVSDTIGALRQVIARLEGEDRRAVAAFGQRRPSRGVAFGALTALDRALRGGLARGGLHEVVAAGAGDASAASGFALALAVRFATAERRKAPIVWIVEERARVETGAPYAPGLACHGIDPARLVVVETASGPDSLWAMEEALECRGVAAVVGEVWRLKSYGLAASRRLVLAAERSGTPGLLVPAGGAGRIDAMSSAARTRFEVKAAPGPHAASAGERTPLPGLAAWHVRLARIRASPQAGAALDRDRFWPILWDHEEACFRDALPLPVSAQARHRPDRARAAERPLVRSA